MKNLYLDELVRQLNACTTDAELLQFLQGILTPKELEEIPKRLQIIKMLKKGVPQRQIASTLEIGIATVTRGSRELQKGSFSNIQ